MALSAIIIEQKNMLRRLLADWLEACDCVNLRGTACDLTAGLALLTQAAPRVAIVSTDLPEGGFQQIVDRITALSPDTTVIGLSPSKLEGLRSFSCVSPEDHPDQLIEAMQAAAGAGDPTRAADDAHPDVEPKVSILTRREREVLALLASGLSAKEAAKVLFVSPRTVDNHTQKMMNKLDIHTRVELTRFAIRKGVVEV